MSQDSPGEEPCNTSSIFPFAEPDPSIDNVVVCGKTGYHLVESVSFGLTDDVLEETKATRQAMSPPLEHQIAVEPVPGENHNAVIFRGSHDVFLLTPGDSEGQLDADHSPVRNDMLGQEGQRTDSGDLHATIDITPGRIHADQAETDSLCGVPDISVERHRPGQKPDEVIKFVDSTSDDMNMNAPDTDKQQILPMGADTRMIQTPATLVETEAKSEGEELLKDDSMMSPLHSTLLNPTDTVMDGGVWSIEELRVSLMEKEAALEIARQECAQKEEQLQIYLDSMTEKTRELSLAERDLLEKEQTIADVKMQMNDQEHCYQDLQHALLQKNDGYTMKLEELNMSQRELEELRQKLLHREAALRFNEELIAEKEQALEHLRHVEAQPVSVEDESSVIQVCWPQRLFCGCYHP